MAFVPLVDEGLSVVLTHWPLRCSCTALVVGFSFVLLNVCSQAVILRTWQREFGFRSMLYFQV